MLRNKINVDGSGRWRIRIFIDSESMENKKKILKVPTK